MPPPSTTRPCGAWIGHGHVANRYRVKTRAVGIAVGGGSLWVVDRLNNSVAAFDLPDRSCPADGRRAVGSHLHRLRVRLALG